MEMWMDYLENCVSENTKELKSSKKKKKVFQEKKENGARNCHESER